MPIDNTPGKLQAHFAGVELARQPAEWDSLWKERFTPWDRGGPSLALHDLLAEREDLVPLVEPPGSHQDKSASEAGAGEEAQRRTALVPGCGRGYDAMLLAAFGYSVYGLDYSDGALDEARETQRSASGQAVYDLRKGVGRVGDVTWVAGDFFSDKWLVKGAGTRKFDLIFDYTFFCALPPSARPAWARRMAELLAPDGRLVCLEFPAVKDPSSGGPPWAAPGDAYLAHLSRSGEEVEYGDDQRVVLPKIEAPMRGGLTRLAWIKPRRTHTAGCDSDGNVEDWISVWAHQGLHAGS